MCRLPGLKNLKCTSKAISPALATFVCETSEVDAAPNRPLTGTEARLDLDRISPVHGLVTSQRAEEFSVAVDESCKETLRLRLSQIAKEANIIFADAPKAINATRIEPETRNCAFVDGTGALRKGKIVNLSQIDVLIRTAIIPARDSRIIFQGSHHRLARVVRSFEIGFAAHFYTPIPESKFSSAISFIGG